MPNPGLDAIDRRILGVLQADARISNAALAEAVGLSPSPCLRRVRALERAGVIKGYAALVEAGAVPRRAADDAAHIAIAVTNGVDFLVTWNFRHIANAAMRASIERVCRGAGYEPPVICTPNELMEANNGNAPD